MLACRVIRTRALEQQRNCSQVFGSGGDGKTSVRAVGPNGAENWRGTVVIGLPKHTALDFAGGFDRFETRNHAPISLTNRRNKSDLQEHRGRESSASRKCWRSRRRKGREILIHETAVGPVIGLSEPRRATDFGTEGCSEKFNLRSTHPLYLHRQPHHHHSTEVVPDKSAYLGMRFGVSLRTLRSSLSVLLSLRLLKRQMDLGEYAIAIGLVVESVSRMEMI